MRVCLFEDRSDFFEPLSLTRPVFDLHCGLTSMARRVWEHFRASSHGALLRPDLAELYRRQHSNVAVNDWTWLAEDSTLLANGLWLPPDERPQLDEPCVGLVGEELAYVWAGREHLQNLAGDSFPAALARLRQELPSRQAGGHIVHFPWELVDHNSAQIGRDLAGPLGASFDLIVKQPRLALVGPMDRLRVHPTAQIEPFVVADTSRGPVVIDEGAVIASFSRIEGPCYIGPHTQIFGAKIRAGTSLGPQCRIGGEVEASIVHGHSNKYHDGFLGHSYVGEWVNLGAGTSNSDLRSDYGLVKVVIQRQSVATGRTKVGCFLGDHVKTGLGTLINTGSNIGAFCNLFPSAELVAKYMPPFLNWSHGKLAEGFPLETLLTTAQEVMRRRQCELTDAHRRLYSHLFEQTAASRQWELREGVRHVRIA